MIATLRSIITLKLLGLALRVAPDEDRQPLRLAAHEFTKHQISLFRLKLSQK